MIAPTASLGVSKMPETAAGGVGREAHAGGSHDGPQELAARVDDDDLSAEDLPAGGHGASSRMIPELAAV